MFKCLFDSRIVRRTVCESMPSRVQKLLQWVVALENQHAIRAVCVCTFDFAENTNKRRSWFIAGNFSLRHATECHTYSIISQVPGWNYFTWRIPGIL